MSTDKIFRTADYKLAAFLLSKNIPVDIQQNPRRPNKAEFSSPGTDQLYRAIAEYNSNEPIPVQNYNENLEIVKDRIMEILRSSQAPSHKAVSILPAAGIVSRQSKEE